MLVEMVVRAEVVQVQLEVVLLLVDQEILLLQVPLKEIMEE
jgi:hypothetical protein